MKVSVCNFIIMLMYIICNDAIIIIIIIIINKYDLSTYANIIHQDRIYSMHQDRFSNDNKISIKIIKYLMSIRKNIDSDHFVFDMTEISDMINFMCIIL